MNIRIQDLSMTYPNGKQALSHLNLEQIGRAHV